MPSKKDKAEWAIDWDGAMTSIRPAGWQDEGEEMTYADAKREVMAFFRRNRDSYVEAVSNLRPKTIKKWM